MSLRRLLDTVRGEVPERVWGAAVKLARDGAVRGVHADDEEIALEVRGRRGRIHEVYLWPDDQDWGCDCELPGDPCVHVVAGVIAMQRVRREGGALPEPEETFRVELRYHFRSRERSLEVTRTARWGGREEPLGGTLEASGLVAARHDHHAEALLRAVPPGPLSAEMLRRLLVMLEGRPEATLDGAPVSLSTEPFTFQVRVRDLDDGFHVGLYTPPGADRLFRGAALVDGVLRPTSHGDLSPEQRRTLVRGLRFGPDRVGVLVHEVLPRLRRAAPVEIQTERLPEAGQLEPRVELALSESTGGLEVRPVLVYGDPPVARVVKGSLVTAGDVLPVRDPGRERAVVRAFEERMGLAVGHRHLLPPARAAAFLAERLPLFGGAVRGAVERTRFAVHEVELAPEIRVLPVEGSLDWRLEVGFAADGGEARADALQVVRAWAAGRSLVPLLDGGYAPLPDGWLEEHGPLLRELLDGRSADGRVPREATAALVELLDGTEEVVPPDLARLREFLEGGEGLPDPPLPRGFRAELRPYQRVGYRWLCFLRDTGLHGILADDMGLGKTVQALAALAATPGPHLVVAPVSVIRGWEREAARFTPSLRVCVYHGPGRVLDGEADVVLTSYALLRMDLDVLGRREWSWVVLDEAQAIKNPDSQTARAACRIRSEHRLALTGTPVENRLEELWSLFRFLMPGLLGGRDAFRDRFVRPVETGDPSAGSALRARVRPYVLRRLKRQVAADLPPLTEVVERCEMSAAQRRIYDGVRLAVRDDVQRAMDERGVQRSTMAVLEALLRLRQAACDPALLPGDQQDVGSCKLDRLEEMLVELVCEDHKVLVFSQWTSMLDRVEERLATLGVTWVRLDGSTRDRQGVVDRFQADDGPPVFLISLMAGGLGLNLTAADYVVHLDPWWNPAVEQQATDRAHRIGQDKPVVSCRLVAQDTVEERVLDLQEAKRGLADAALGTEGGMIRALTARELRGLFDAA